MQAHYIQYKATTSWLFWKVMLFCTYCTTNYTHTHCYFSHFAPCKTFFFFFTFFFFSNMSTLACISELHTGEGKQSNKRKDTSMLMCRFLLVWVLSDVEPVKAISSYGKLLCWSAKLNYLSTLSLCCHFDFFSNCRDWMLGSLRDSPQGSQGKWYQPSHLLLSSFLSPGGHIKGKIRIVKQTGHRVPAFCGR